MAPLAGEGPSLPLSPWQTRLMMDRQPKLRKHSASLTSRNLDSHSRARDCFYIQVTDGKPKFEERKTCPMLHGESEQARVASRPLPPLSSQFLEQAGHCCCPKHPWYFCP